MPMIYKRFTEKSAEEWRQIYKACPPSPVLQGSYVSNPPQALQLLEFLIKNGAEQVIDDARSHLSTIKMLRQFYFIDNAGKDQGVNVRNRAKELAELLSDVDRIRAERKKARQTKNKYIGVEGGLGGGFSNTPGSRSSGGRFGGFGSDAADFGGYSGGVYGDGGGFGGRSASGFHDDSNGGSSAYHSRSASRNQYEEYDEADEAPRRAPARRPVAAAAAKPPPPKKKEPEPDLLGGFDDPLPATTTTSAAATNDDDDFDDFQSAAPAPTSTFTPAASFSPPPQPPLTSSASGISLIQPKPVSTTDATSLHSLVGLTSPAITPAAPNYFTSVPAAANNTPPVTQQQQQKKPANDAFGNIWNQASSGVRKTQPPKQQNTPSLQALQKEKASAGIWGTTATSPTTATGGQGQKIGGGLEDLLG
jgi:epsin